MPLSRAAPQPFKCKTHYIAGTDEGGPPTMTLQGCCNSHYAAHLNTSTCDCAPGETIDSLHMQVPSANRSHMPALTTSCPLQPCNARIGLAPGVTHHLHHIASKDRVPGVNKAMRLVPRLGGGPTCARYGPCACRRQSICCQKLMQRAAGFESAHCALSRRRWGSIMTHLCSNVDDIAGIVSQRSLVALQVGGRVCKLQLKGGASCCARPVVWKVPIRP